MVVVGPADEDAVHQADAGASQEGVVGAACAAEVEEDLEGIAAEEAVAGVALVEVEASAAAVVALAGAAEAAAAALEGVAAVVEASEVVGEGEVDIEGKPHVRVCITAFVCVSKRARRTAAVQVARRKRMGDRLAQLLRVSTSSVTSLTRSARSYCTGMDCQ